MDGYDEEDDADISGMPEKEATTCTEGGCHVPCDDDEDE